MRKENVAGFFFVTLDLRDVSGRSLHRIDSTAQRPQVVVIVKNISGATRGAGIVVELPNPSPSLEFVGNHLPTSASGGQWIPQNGVITLKWDIRCNGGTVNLAEPVRVAEVWDYPQGTQPVLLPCTNVPFEITVAT